MPAVYTTETGVDVPRSAVMTCVGCRSRDVRVTRGEPPLCGDCSEPLECALSGREELARVTARWASAVEAALDDAGVPEAVR